MLLIKKTKVSVSLDTANGLKHITEAVNVPNAKGLMDRSLVVDGCSRSLCPVVSVCESKQLGFELVFLVLYNMLCFVLSFGANKKRRLM